MISVLIPTYNYSVIALVEELHKQLEASKTIYEIIVWDDASTETFHLQNRIINHVPNIHYFRSEDHFGKPHTRQLLYKKSVFNWLLYVDADVMPKSPSFIQDYLDLIPKDYDVVYGGCAYAKIVPPESMRLHWAYGNAEEDLPAQTRNQKPYQYTNSNNFLIKRSVFSAINTELSNSKSNLDAYFGTLLKHQALKVKHVDNDVYHLGIVSNAKFLETIKTSLDQLLQLHLEGKITAADNHLLHKFKRLKSFGLCWFYSRRYEKSHKQLEENFLGPKPSISKLRHYKILYLCYQYKNRN